MESTETIADLKDQIKELENWKESQIKTWLPILEFVQDYGDKMGLQVGESISEFILKIIKKEYYSI